jgi:hypothetical protein
MQLINIEKQANNKTMLLVSYFDNSFNKYNIKMKCIAKITSNPIIRVFG